MAKNKFDYREELRLDAESEAQEKRFLEMEMKAQGISEAIMDEETYDSCYDLWEDDLPWGDNADDDHGEVEPYRYWDE